MEEYKKENEELELYEYIRVILKRKKVVLISFLVSVITAIVINFLSPKAYQSASLIQIGSIDNKLLIKKEKAKRIITSQNILISAIQNLRLNIRPSQLKRNIKIENIKDTDLLRIKLEFSNEELAIKINKAIAESFISYGQKIYDRKVSLINEQLNELEKEIENVKKEVEEIYTVIKQLSCIKTDFQQKTSLTIILGYSILYDYKNYLTSLKKLRNEMELALVNSKKFKFVDFPSNSVVIKPRRRVNIAISAGVGLILGIFLAFFIEFLSINYQEKSGKK